MKTNIGSVANNVQIGRGGLIFSDSSDESISVKSANSADLVDFYAKNLNASKISADYALIKNFNLDSINFAKNIYPLTNMQMALNTDLRFPWYLGIGKNNYYNDLYIGGESQIYTIDITDYDSQQLAGISYFIIEDDTSTEKQIIVSEPLTSLEDFRIFIENNLESKATVSLSSNFLTFTFTDIIPTKFKLLGFGYESVSANNLLNCLESSPNGFGLINSRYISNCILGYSLLPGFDGNSISLYDNSVLKISDGILGTENNESLDLPRNYLKSIVPEIIETKIYIIPSLTNNTTYQVVWNEDIKSIELIDQTKFYFEGKSNLLSSLPTDGSYLYARIQKLNYNYKFNASTNSWEVSHFCKFGILEVDVSGNKIFYPEYPVNFNPMDLKEQLGDVSVKKYVKTFSASDFSNNKLSISASEHKLGSDCSLIYARKKQNNNYYKDTFVQFSIDINGNVIIESEPFEGKLVLQKV